jgi:phage terminase small subunit
MGRSTNLNKPNAMQGMPEPPADLSEEGHALWATTLAARPAAEWTAADCTLVALYVRCALDVQRLDKQIEQRGELVRNAAGTPIVSPLVTLRARREATLMTLAKRLRLTPCSRYTAKDVGRLHGHARKAQSAAAALDSDDLLAKGGRLQ